MSSSEIVPHITLPGNDSLLAFDNGYWVNKTPKELGLSLAEHSHPEYPYITVSATAPLAPRAGDGWLDTSAIAISLGKYALETVSSNTNLDENNTIVICTAALTLNLPASTGNVGLIYFLKSTGGTVTVTPNGAETIDGAATLSLTAGQSAIICSDGSNWHILSQ